MEISSVSVEHPSDWFARTYTARLETTRKGHAHELAVNLNLLEATAGIIVVCNIFWFVAVNGRIRQEETEQWTKLSTDWWVNITQSLLNVEYWLFA